MLPVPVISFRLTGKDSNGELLYTCVLENPEDYEGYGAFNIVVKSPYISYNNNKEAVVDGETGYLEGIKPLQSDLGASINSVTAQAVSSDETMKSRVSSGQTQILWKGALSKDSISIGKYGFRGCLLYTSRCV